MDCGVFGARASTYRSASGGRGDVSALADVIPIAVVVVVVAALKNPFAETAFAAAAADFVTRLVTAPPLFLAPFRSAACRTDGEGGRERGRRRGSNGFPREISAECAKRIESRRRRQRGPPSLTHSLTHSLSPSVTHVTRVGCERRQKNLINAHHIVLITRVRQMIREILTQQYPKIDRLTPFKVKKMKAPLPSYH